MKIIKHGTPLPPPVEGMIAECSACGCVFTFGKHESRQVTNNGGGSVYFATCPECGQSGCAFDTGYPRDNDKDRDLNRKVTERQAALWLLAASPEVLKGM